jgi:protein-S-isoprenylcysteine O-methyltransferase Ste14
LNGLYYYDDYIIYDSAFSIDDEIGVNMNTKSETQPTEKQANIVTGILMRVGTVVVFMILIAGILFIASGRITWLWAWVYLGISIVFMLINGTIMLRINAETIAERGQPKETKSWDKTISGLYALAVYLALPLVAGLDVRYGWTKEISVTWHIAGALLFVAGLVFTAWAMIVNAYFSTAVRIQSERGHTVCRTGPYRFVRHPGYVGFIFQAISCSILWGSWWSLVPALFAVTFMGIRTYLEDRTLQAELPGYPEYMQAVRYRLVPGIW